MPLLSGSRFQLINEILIGKLRGLQAILTNNVKYYKNINEDNV